MRSRLLMLAAIVVAATVFMACSTTGGATSSPSAATSAAPSAAPSASAEEPSEEPSASAEEPSAATGATVEVGTFPDAEWLVAGSNDMTVYIFTKDVKDSGVSVCTDGCLETWPALTVEEGETPSGGDGVTGTLGTITRADDGTIQVTYNGLPLYFFKNDQEPGDTAGIYENWEAVAP